MSWVYTKDKLPAPGQLLVFATNDGLYLGEYKYDKLGNEWYWTDGEYAFRHAYAWYPIDDVPQENN